MKNLFCLSAILFLLTLSLSAQPYEPFCVNGKGMDRDFYQGLGVFDPDFGWAESTYIWGDSVFGGHTWSIVWDLNPVWATPGHNPPFLSYGPPTIKYFAREDTTARKVWITWNVSAPEILYLDFSLQAGDTMPNGGIIDTIYLASTPSGPARWFESTSYQCYNTGQRKEYIVEGWGYRQACQEVLPVAWLEGIGTYCWWIDSVPPGRGCSALVNREPELSEEEVQFGVDHQSRSLWIEMNQVGGNLEIRDLTGRTVLGHELGPRRTELSLERLRAGLYVLRLRTANSQKVVKIWVE